MDNTRKKLVENYEDALFALLMDDYMQKEGNQIIPDENDSIDIPDGMENRGLKSIRSGFRRLRLKRFLRSSGKIAVRIAIVVLAINFAFSTAFLSVEAFRVKVLNMMLEYQETHTAVQFQPSVGTGQTYTIDDIQHVVPNGYVFDPDQYEQYRDGERAFFCNPDGLIIEWSSLPIATGLSLDTENADIVEEIKVGEYDGLLVEKNGCSQITWGDYNAERVYYCNADFPSDQLLDMIEKLVQLK